MKNPHENLAPPSVFITGNTELSADQQSAVDDLTHALDGTSPEITSTWFAAKNPDIRPDNPINTTIPRKLVETGAWSRITFDPDTSFAIEVNPDYQINRLQLSNDGANNGALQDVVRTAVHAAVDRSFFYHRLQ